MKKITLALIAAAFVSSLCFAAEPQATAGEVKTFIGRVEKVVPTVGRKPSSPRCKILAVSDTGEKFIFFVPGNLPVIDVNGKDMSEGGKKIGGMLLKKGERIEVKYSTITNGSRITNGQNGAVSIRCLD